ncbi:tellurite resistance TerB C-terminal domain-containing protein [Chlorogloeopsis sp. ULAP01]|uniref:tellurite resistance TerB C-terminal domain-containing protein n=1 Tax=Chlorogloeopsis sp. ULAP01 TaxID=3056483 RepID=UPI0025AAA45E|nr:tellurite resistance TerB C-terminal domain-containing protein [Chlorogloeopsis sp. ULAP01]MDM9380514.1 tellurite resistance TerB C-terminal domain-containing protein [Chlorogloeopsis sp. ULAP01]
MQSAMVSNRFILGIVAFGISFGLSLALTWNFGKSFIIGLITLIVTYSALFVEQQQRNHEMLARRDSLHRRIRELEGLKSRMLAEINQLEAHHALLYQESNKFQNQVVERRNQRDILNRELSSFIIEKKQLESQINYLQDEISNLESTKVEINKSFSNLNADKRRLELNYNVSKAEINQLQTQISELQQHKQELESNLVLLGRLKPQLEEKLYQMRVKIHEMETEEKRLNQVLLDVKAEKGNVESNLNSLRTQVAEQETQLHHLQEQVILLQDERDNLQSQVWELLQQTEVLHNDNLLEPGQEEEVELFPFAELIEPTENSNYSTEIVEIIPEDWVKFVEKLPNHEIQVLKAIIEQENPYAAIKKIAEDNITMPNLLIDSINERANDTLGELIIDPSSDAPEIYPEHQSNVERAIAVYQDMMARLTSSN